MKNYVYWFLDLFKTHLFPHVWSCFFITNLYKICYIAFVGSINSFLLLLNIIGTNAMILFVIRSMSFSTCCFMFPNKWCDDKRSCINLSTLEWNSTTHFTKQSFQSNDVCICFAIFSMLIISSHWRELVSSNVSVKKKWHSKMFNHAK